MPQPRQRNRHFLLVAATHSVRNYIHFVSGPQQVECGLSDADVALDADDYAGERAGGVEGIEGLFDFWRSVVVSISYLLDGDCRYIIENSVLSW
jgi:hypothetical protein